MNVTAGILVGGHSRRMGRPKGLLRVDGVTLLERTAAVAREVAGRVVLLGRPPFELPAGVAGLEILEDAQAGVGPLAGLVSLMAACGARPAVLLACDLPRLEAGLIGRLLGEAGGDVDAVVYATGEPPRGWEPCCSVYLPGCAPVAAGRMARGEYSLVGLLEAVRTRTVRASDDEAAKLANLNRPEDVAALEAGE
jgi:molybdopterin-guanine dinucleotide biosynthesis protein A